MAFSFLDLGKSVRGKSFGKLRTSSGRTVGTAGNKAALGQAQGERLVLLGIKRTLDKLRANGRWERGESFGKLRTSGMFFDRFRTNGKIRVRWRIKRP